MRIRDASEAHRRRTSTEIWGTKEQLFRKFKTGDDTPVGYKLLYLGVGINYFGKFSLQKYPASALNAYSCTHEMVS